MNKTLLSFLVALVVAFPLCRLQAQTRDVDHQVDSVLQLMTLDEKVGQMNQYNGNWDATGPITETGDIQDQIRKGMVGSMLNVTGVEHTTELQKIAMQSRLKIPLLFGQDIIHGYRTTFPIPLAEAASWNMTAIEQSARIAATEAAAAGVHWTFAPMVDIARDPRWGRVMEGAGEDPFLGSRVAEARVRGFQGNGLGHTDAVMACAKHFAAYGAAIGGRDYNSVDMSLNTLWNIYLPPFRAAEQAGVATFMNSFNTLNGIPATGNAYLQTDVLKGRWKFTGFIVSDWNSVGEMIPHGYARDGYDASVKAANAGNDMDMESRSYILNLARAVRDGQVPVTRVDDAVRRILKKKFEMGLFDDPFRYSSRVREQQQWNRADHLAAERSMAEKSIVLLKNEHQLLPLSRDQLKGHTIALIGPFMKGIRDNLGFWSYTWPDDSSRIISPYEGIRRMAGPDVNVLYARGCNVDDSSLAGFGEALDAARKADIVIMDVGEAPDWSGEAKSRSNLHLPGMQEQLVRAISETGKPLIVMISAGRPLIFNWIADHVPAILYTWWLGTEAGDAMADVLFGKYNPSGKLPMTFPRSEGQIPIYYNHLNTGRPPKNDSDLNYVSSYIDLPNSPRYPFGFGLSYTTFSYSTISLSSDAIGPGDTLRARVTLTNTGSFDGTETVQLYIRDLVASIVQPVRVLRGFRQLLLKAGQQEIVTFSLTAADLGFYNDRLEYASEPGAFQLFIGNSSEDARQAFFRLRP